MNLNKVFVLGNVTRDPEARALPSGQQVTSFGIATNRFYTDQAGVKKQDVEFHNIVAFGKLADTISRFVTKGSLILIEGRIKTGSWMNASGVKQYKTEIIAENLQLGPRPTGGGSGNSGSGGQYNKSYSPQGSASQKNEDIPIIEENYNAPVQENTEGEINVADIPF